MNTYIVLLRGINVGGKNKIPMAELRARIEELGFSRVSTYIASGNVILRSDEDARTIRARIEGMLPKRFKLDSDLVKVLVLSRAQLKKIIEKKPAGFGEQPQNYHSDVIFLMDISPARAMDVFDPREGVDTIWKGSGAIYSQRLSAQRIKSRLNRVMGTPEYQQMTIRNWNTVTKLVHLAEDATLSLG